MRQHIHGRIAERLQSRPWLEVLESRLTPSKLLHSSQAVVPPLEQSLHAIAAPAERASDSAESDLTGRDHALSRFADKSARFSDGLGFAGKDADGDNQAMGVGSGISVTIQTDEVSVTFARGSSVVLDSESTPSARQAPSVAGRNSELSSDPPNANSVASAPIVVLFIVSEPRIELRFFSFAPTSIVSSNNPSATSNSEPTGSAAADISTTPAAARQLAAFNNVSLTPSAAATSAANTVATTANPVASAFGDAALRLLTVAARPASLDRAFQASGDNSAAARNASLLPGPISDPTRTITGPATPPQRLPSGGGGDDPAKGAEATPPVKTPIISSGDGQNPEAIVGAEKQEPAALSSRVGRIVAGSVAGAAVLYLALNSYGRSMMRKWKSRRPRTPTLTQ
jgi:hypothetical protein